MRKACDMGAIPTKFNGIEYRSRLEARWAAFMHNIGWQHTYEPFDGDGYIPDFIVHGNRPLFIEVKPALMLTEYQEPQAKVSRGLAEFTHDVLIVGANPFPAISRMAWFPAAGWMGEYMDGPTDLLGQLSWDVGQWITCGECNSIAVFHTIMSFGGRPCWCASGGDHHMSDPPIHLMRGMWDDACNEVKWRGRAA